MLVVLNVRYPGNSFSAALVLKLERARNDIAFSHFLTAVLVLEQEFCYE